MNDRAIEASFRALVPELLSTFGRERLEEKAFPAYTNRLAPARYLAWCRIRLAQRLLAGRSGRAALDFGSGFGVMLPFLASRFERVIACDDDVEVTQFMVERLGLEGVEVVRSLEAAGGPFEVVTALDVLEHIEDLGPIYEQLITATTDEGAWVISGPTENALYGLMRKVARTKGDESHVHTVAEVLRAAPTDMARVQSKRLPWGLPLFVVAEFDRARTAGLPGRQLP